MNNNPPIKVKKIWPFNGPLSVYENKVLTMTEKTFVRNGKCNKCGDVIKMSTVYESDFDCAECKYRLPKQGKRKNA